MAIELIGRSNWDGNELLNFVAGITEPWDESDFVSVRPKIIDPFGGIDDIRDKVIRHVSSAFKEDPLRVLRAFRFLARFGDGWCVSSATKLFCQEIARDGGLDHLTPERVWGEIEKALSGNRPSLFFSGLAEVCDIFPEWNAMIGVHQRTQHHPEKWVDVHTGMVMDWAALNTGDPMVVFAGLCHDFGKPLVTTEDGKAHNHEAAGVPVVKAFCDKWKVPNDFRDIAIMTCRDHLKVHSCLGRGDQKGLKASTIMKMFEENRALQKPELFNQFLTACEADAKGRGGDFPTRDYRQAEFLFKCLEAVIKLDTKPIAEDAIARGKKFEQIGEAVRRARINVIQEVKDLWN
jgi:tRNA nucleotidyltransferase (CCA-adding enzyme)